MRPEDGRSARNAFVELAFRSAPSLPDLLTHATAVPAGVDEGEYGVVRPSKKAIAQYYPQSAQLISSKMPLGMLQQAAKSSRLPSAARAQTAVTAWVRAMILDDRAVAKSMASVVSTLNPNLGTLVQRATAGRSRADRRLGLLVLLLRAPASGTSLYAWRPGPIALGKISSTYDAKWWCGSPVAGGNAGTSFAGQGQGSGYDLRFLTGAERARRDREIQKLQKLGTAPTFLANEAADLAALLPQDPRIPEVLHLAVRATRFGCKDASTTKASARAFRALHRKYPGTSWAKKTPYHY